MTSLRAIILSLVAAASVVSGPAAHSADVSRARTEVNARLSRAVTSADSIAPLYDLYDLSTRAERPSIGFTLHDVALRAGDTATALDMLRQLSVYYSPSDSMLRVINTMIREIPDSDDKRESLTFNNIFIKSREAEAADEDERQADLRRAIREYAAAGDEDLYSRIERLFVLCKYMSGVTEGDLLTRYYDKLDQLISQLPPSRSDALRNQYYTSAANAYTYNGNCEQAIAADRRLLEIIDDLKARYKARGRKYRNYYTTEYVIARRMLNNYKALTPEEIQQCYDTVLNLCDKDPDIAADRADNHRADIYYFMANKRYDEALPLLLDQLEKGGRLKYRVYLLRSIIEAAQATGNTDILTDYALTYSRMLEEYIDNKSAERYRELEIIYDTQELKSHAAQLELHQANERAAQSRRMLVIVLILMGALLVVLGWGVLLYRRSRRLSRSLEASNESLRAESRKLIDAQQSLIRARDEAREAVRQKNNFINNISHEALAPLNAIVEYSLLIADSVDEAKRPYFGRFADNVTSNAELLQKLMTDVLEVGSIDSPNLTITRASADLGSICETVLSTIGHDVPEGVRLVCDRKALPSIVINTDAKRVEQVLVNLLDNALKFTEKGTVELSAAVTDDGDRRMVTFAVTDTGIGIEPDDRERAFERFEKLGRQSRGIGLGLSVSRTIARHLGGDVIIDPDYKGPGTRALFTLPL